jgi:hypothetical protein
MVLLAGCYSLQPAGATVVQPGNMIAMDINDAGRVALGGAMGPEIAQIEGRVVQNEGGVFTIAVTDVHLLRGGDQVWRGENVKVRSEWVNTIYERRLAKVQSVMLAAAGVAAAGLLVSRGLNGLGDPSHPEPSPADTGHTTRRPNGRTVKQP